MNSWCLLTLWRNLLDYRLADNEISPKERAFSSGGERFPDTEEATSSNLVTPTTKDQVRRLKYLTCFFFSRLFFED